MQPRIMDCVDQHVARLTGAALNQAVAMALNVPIVYFDDAFAKRAREKGLGQYRIDRLIEVQILKGTWVTYDDTYKIVPIRDYQNADLDFLLQAFDFDIRVRKDYVEAGIHEKDGTTFLRGYNLGEAVARAVAYQAFGCVVEMKQETRAAKPAA